MTTTKSSAASPRSLTRGLSARWLQLSVPLLVLALSPRPTQADIIYTWTETDQQSVTGSMDVSQHALNVGVISISDVDSFTFTVPGLPTFTQIDEFDTISSDNMVPINSTGIVTQNAIAIISINPQTSDVLAIPFSSSSFSSTNPEAWIIENTTDQGFGYWSVSITTTVPEPSTAVLAMIGAVSGLAYGWSRHSRGQRRQVSA